MKPRDKLTGSEMASNRDFEYEHRALIAVAEAGWNGSPCWHIFDWMAWKLRCKYPVIRKVDQIINLEGTGKT